MGSNQRQQLQEQYEEAALALLMDEYAEAEGAKLLREFEELKQKGELPEIPAELDKKCKHAIDSAFAAQKRKHALKQIVKFAAKAAAVFLVVLGLSTVTVLSVDAFRVPVLIFIEDRSGLFSRVVYSETMETKTDSVSATVERFEGCLPEGYYVREKQISRSMGVVYCVNSSRSVISLDISRTDGALAVDTEDASFVEVEFGNYPAALQEKNGYRLIWIGEDETVYFLHANNLSFEEFWELAYATAGCG